MRRRLAHLGALLLVTTGLVAVGFASPPQARALAAPIVDPPKCFPRAFGNIVDCYDVLPNGTYGPFGMSASVSGSATPGGTFSVTITPRVAACTSTGERGCYESISHYHDGGVFYLPYANSLLTQRAAKSVTGVMSTHAPTLTSTLPDTGTCDADWTNAYADGGNFAARAEATRTCVFRYKYQNAQAQQVPLDNLLGPTWLRIYSSVTVRKPEGGIESETMTSLVRIDGDLAPGPVAQCTAQSGFKVGVAKEFSVKSSMDSKLDSIAAWATQPNLPAVNSGHSSSTHQGWLRVVPTQPGTLKATVTLQTWQGTSQAVCTVDVEPGEPGTGDPGPGNPDPNNPGGGNPGGNPDAGNPGENPPPAPSCTLSGKPTLKGAAKVGKKVKVKPGPWSVPDSKLVYQWTVGGKKVGKRTARSLKVKPGHLGAVLKVKVTLKRDGCADAKVTLKAGKIREAGKVR